MKNLFLGWLYRKFAPDNNKGLKTLKSCIMETNWIIISIVVVLAMALIIYLVVRDQKDKKDMTETLNNETDAEDEIESDKEHE